MKAKIKATGEIVELNEQGISLFEYARGIYKDVNGHFACHISKLVVVDSVCSDTAGFNHTAVAREYRKTIVAGDHTYSSHTVGDGVVRGSVDSVYLAYHRLNDCLYFIGI